ncbi:hypothetical protein EUGRSUZ_A01581 [Eucalyptus grandis]|uniref:Uncharacterized protein n=2 Tax=Eucalyptus grandis TaxID=71139 RepID=A0ACC3M2R8_EUCGR|nr:hypothetical protein EUGRSUZ_A01581 [Eucalyptus grandis]
MTRRGGGGHERTTTWDQKRNLPRNTVVTKWQSALISEHYRDDVNKCNLWGRKLNFVQVELCSFGKNIKSIKAIYMC